METIGIVFIILGVVIVAAVIPTVIILVLRGRGKQSSYLQRQAISAQQKGIEGENLIISILGEDIPNQRYTINNLTIVSQGKSSQIDHIAISSAGILVIETKNYAGQIYGSKEQREWVQVLNYGRTKNKFYNPIMQSNTHVYRLRQVLGKLAKKDCFIQAVVFPGAELKTGYIDGVGNIQSLINTLNVPREQIYNANEINEIYNLLLNIKNNPAVTDQEHINSIYQTQLDIANNICPRCQKSLVLRSGQYGSFYGCTGYPYCKFKKQL